ncbi:MAG: hypothetical protein AAGA56_04215 [Myxococcota bacterium]
MFPYLAGLRFVFFARAQKTWTQFDEIYKNPPVSTEQIIHPEKYFANELPTILEFSARKALPQHTKVYDNVLGEFQTYLMLHESLHPEKSAKKTSIDISQAAAGWGGDRLLAYLDKSGNVLTVHASTWDTDKDAVEFFQAFQAGLKQRYSSAKVVPCAKKIRTDQTFCLSVPGTRPHRVHLEIRKDRVLYIDGAPETKASPDSQPVHAIREATIESFKRVPFKKALQQAEKRAKARQAAKAKASKRSTTK